MTNKQIEQFNRMREALRIIAIGYQTTNQLRRNCSIEYGTEYMETLEMAYDNIREIAKEAARGVRQIINENTQKIKR